MLALRLPNDLQQPMPPPSVLEYARFHDLSTYTDSRDLLSHLKGFSKLPGKEEATAAVIDTPYGQVQLPEDKLQIGAEAGALLARCTKAPDIHSNGLVLLDCPRPRLLLELEMPILKHDHSKDMKWFRAPLDLNNMLQICARDSQIDALWNEEMPDVFEECKAASDEIENEIALERFQTSKEVLTILSTYLKDRWSSRDEDEMFRRELPSPPSGLQMRLNTVATEELPAPYSDISDTKAPKDYQYGPSGDMLTETSQTYPVNSFNEMRGESLGLGEKTLRPQVKDMQRVDIKHPGSSQTPEELFATYFDQAGISRLTVDARQEESLNWIPVSRQVMQVDMDEELEAGNYLTQIVKKPEEIIGSQQLLWKEPGLRLLEVTEDEDEELEEDSDPIEAADIVTEPEIPQKRQLQVEFSPAPIAKQQKCRLVSERDILRLVPAPTQCLGTMSRKQAQVKLAESATDSRLRRRLKESSYTSALGPCLPVLAPTSRIGARSDNLTKKADSQLPQSFSATGSLSSFLDLRGRKFKKPAMPDLGSPETEVIDDPIQVSQPGTSVLSGHHGEDVEVPSTPTCTSKSALLPCPRFERLKEPRTIVVDDALVENRAVVKMLDRNADSNLTTIYRDLKSQPDIILDPVTCMMYINVQALAQRTLPGHRTESGVVNVQARVRWMASEYELVFVLVTISANLAGPPSQLQSSHMASFASYCASLSSSQENGRVCPLWIPVKGGPRDQSEPEPLCAWTWSLICRHALHTSPRAQLNQNGEEGSARELLLIQEITLWELFLCRCGMNAMAAQVVFCVLKKPSIAKQVVGDRDAAQNEAHHEEPFGLRRFVRMPHTQRGEIFEDLVGGKCLKRMSEMLDTKWSGEML